LGVVDTGEKVTLEEEVDTDCDILFEAIKELLKENKNKSSNVSGQSDSASKRICK